VGSASAPSLTVSGDTNTGIYFPTADTIGFAEGGVEAARIDSSGRLLVGTSTARSNFFNSTDTPQVQLEGTTTSTSALAIIRNSDSTGYPSLNFGKTRGSSVGSTTVVQSGDIVGSLEFQGSDGTEFVQAASIRAEVDGTPGANDMPGRLVFSTTRDGAASPTEAARINNLGAFKATTTGSHVSTSNSTHELVNGNTNEEVVARIRHTATTSNLNGLAIDYSGQSPNNATSRFLICGDSTFIRAEIRSNGGLANFSGNNVNLSDINTKKDISTAADTWDCIKEWQIVNYRYKDQPDDADLNLGVIAQQVAESCPEVITVFQEAKEATEDQPSQEERLGVKEQQMMWMAIKALQEAQLRIEALEAEVTALKAS